MDSDQADASSYMRRRAAADPLLANRWAHRFVPPPTTYASPDDEMPQPQSQQAAQQAQGQQASAMLREDYDDPFNTHQPMALAHDQQEMRHQPDQIAEDDDEYDPFASQEDPVAADEQQSAGAADESSSSDRASKRARLSTDSTGLAAAAASSTSSGTSSSASSPHQQQPQPQASSASVAAAVPIPRSTKRFSKAHQAKEGRTIVATARVNSEIPREPEEPQQEALAASSTAASSAAASSNPVAAAAPAVPAVPVTPTDLRRRKRSQAASAGETQPAAPSTPPSSSAALTPPASASSSSAAAGATTSPRVSLDALKSFFSRHPAGLAAASAASAAAASAPAKPATNGAAATAAAESGGWTSAQPTLADFPATASAGASPVSTCGAPWIADYSSSSSTARYPPAVIEERIAFLAKQVSREEGSSPRSNNATALKHNLPNLTLTPTFLVMGCAVIMRQSRLSREHASQLLPILETVVREHMMPPALLSNFRTLFGQFRTKVEHRHLSLLSALQMELSQDPSPPSQQSQFRSNAQLTCRHWVQGTCTYGDNCTFRHGTVESHNQPQPDAAAAAAASGPSTPLTAPAAAPFHAAPPPMPRTPPRSVFPVTPPLAGLLGHMPAAAGHVPWVVTPALSHAIPTVIERPAFTFHSDSPPPPHAAHLPLPPPPPPTQHQHQQHQPSYAAVAAAASSHPAHVQFTSQHHPSAQGQQWGTTDYSQQQQQQQHHVFGATTPLGRNAPSRRWDAPPPLRAPLSASFVPAAAAAAAPKMQPSSAAAPTMKQPAPYMSPFNFLASSAAVAAGSASGSSASTAICLEDSEPAVTVESVVASQTLSLADSHAFVQSSFASDDLIHRQKLPLVDPLTLARISIPVRSRHCHHVRCLDLATILMQAAETASRGKPLRCPICNEGIALQDLVVDSFIKMRLEEASRLPDASELILHRDGSYTFTGDNGKELKPMARTQSAPSLSEAAAAGGTETAAAAASSSSSTAKSSSKRDTVDLLDSDAEQSESEAPPPPRRPQPPPASRPRSAAAALPPAASVPRSQYSDKRPRSSSSAGAASDADADDESRSEDVSRSSTPIHRGRAFSDPSSSDAASASASSSAASSPALVSRRPPAAAAAGAPVPYPSSYAIPRSAWNGPSVLLGHGGAAAAPRGSPSQLRPAIPAAGAAGPRHADIDLTLSSDESDESSVQAIDHAHAQAAPQQAHAGEHHDEVAEHAAASGDAVVPAAAAASSSSSPVKPPSGADDAADGAVDLDAFSPEINLLSPPLAHAAPAASKHPHPQAQQSAAQILQIEEFIDDQLAASVPVHPPSLSSLPPPAPASSLPSRPPSAASPSQQK